MRTIFFPCLLLLTAGLGGCGEAIRDDHFANDVKAERETEVTTTSAAVVRIGELGPSFAACGAAGTTRNVAAGAALGVQQAPFSSAAEAGSIPSGTRFFVCSRSLDQKWFGIVYDGSGALAARCGVSAPVATRRDYAGPCNSGWVSSAFVKLIAGNDELPPAPTEAEAEPAASGM